MNLFNKWLHGLVEFIIIWIHLVKFCLTNLSMFEWTLHVCIAVSRWNTGMRGTIACRQSTNQPPIPSLIKLNVAFFHTINGHRWVIDCGLISQVVIQDTHARHVLMHSDLLGFLDCLLHVETLLLSSVSREDGEHVELNAIHEWDPGFHANPLVGFAVHANPGVLCVHLVYNPVPLRCASPTTKQWNSS